MDDYGEKCPMDMPDFFFSGATRLEPAKALKANISVQNASVIPRFWYVDAYFLCKTCKTEFLFSAKEQRTWYEEYGFIVDSKPKHCMHCRQSLREEKLLRKEYNEQIAEVLDSANAESKQKMINCIDELCEVSAQPIPSRISENRRLLGIQARRLLESAL